MTAATLHATMTSSAFPLVERIAAAAALARTEPSSVVKVIIIPGHQVAAEEVLSALAAGWRPIRDAVVAAGCSGPHDDIPEQYTVTAALAALAGRLATGWRPPGCSGPHEDIPEQDTVAAGMPEVPTGQAAVNFLRKVASLHVLKGIERKAVREALKVIDGASATAGGRRTGVFLLFGTNGQPCGVPEIQKAIRLGWMPGLDQIELAAAERPEISTMIAAAARWEDIRDLAKGILLQIYADRWHATLRDQRVA